MVWFQSQGIGPTKVVGLDNCNPTQWLRLNQDKNILLFLSFIVHLSHMTELVSDNRDRQSSRSRTLWCGLSFCELDCK